MKKSISILLATSLAISGVAIVYAKDRKPEVPVQNEIGRASCRERVLMPV